MDDAFRLAIWVLLPSLALWFAVSALVAAAFLHLTDRASTDRLRLGSEAWIAVAASGAAGGGFLGFTMALAASPAAQLGFGLLAVVTKVAAGMLLGAGLAATLAFLALWFASELR